MCVFRICYRLLAFLLIGSLLCFSLFGFMDAKSIDRFAYVVAIGIDVGSSTKLRLSFQISVPSGESGSSGGSSEQSSNVIVTTVDCDTVDSGINLVNSYISKQLNLTNCKVIVFSEEIASRGISDYIYTFINDKEIRPNVDVVISKNDAQSFLENSEPTLEKLSARYYDVITNSAKYTGYTSHSTIGTYFASIRDTFMQPSAVLGAVSNSSAPDNLVLDMNGVSSYSPDSSYTSGQAPIENEKPGIVNMGMAVFYSDRLVGELSGMETICHLLVTNQLDSCYLTIPSPFDGEASMDLYVQQAGRTKSKVSFVNGSPFIEVDVKVKARILSLTENSNYLSSENLEKIEEYANSYLENFLLEYLYKTSKVFHSDIAGFGKFAVTHFARSEDWENFHWLELYKDSFFRVGVDTNVASSYLLLRT